MKKIFYLACMLFVLTFGVTIYSCSSDDDNSPSDYTTDEIVEILNGKWTIKGTYNDYTYTATIEFQDNKKYRIRNVLINGDKQSYIFYSSPGENGSYNILRRGGESYISLNEYDFKIISLSKKSFLFVYDNYNKKYNDENLYISMETY